MKKNSSVIGWVCMTGLLLALSAQGHASQDAPNDLYAMQCIEGVCYYPTGKRVPDDVLMKFQQQLAAEMAKAEQEEGHGDE